MELKQISFDDNIIYRFPDLFKLDDGRLIMTWREMSKDRFSFDGSKVVLSYSDDEGQSWSQPKVLAEYDKDENSVPCLQDFTRFARLPDGKLIMGSGIRVRPRTHPDGPAFEAGWYESNDEGKSWSGPVLLGFSAYQISRPRLLGDGCLGMTVQNHKSGADEHNWKQRRWWNDFYVSNDGGNSWKKRSTIYGGLYYPFCICEVDCVVYEDGLVRIWSRDETGYSPGIIFESTDNGFTWSTCPMNFLGHHLAADIIPGTQQAMVAFRGCHFKWPPAVAVWWDDGSQWGKYLEIHAGRWGNHTGRYDSDVGQWIQLSDGNFLLAYSIRFEAETEVKVWTAKFSLDEFVKPTIG